MLWGLLDAVIPGSNTGCMKTSTMTVKGQVTVPKELREAFGWKAGDRVGFVREKDCVKIVSVDDATEGREVVERLRHAAWNRKLSTRRLMNLTRGSGR